MEGGVGLLIGRSTELYLRREFRISGFIGIALFERHDLKPPIKRRDIFPPSGPTAAIHDLNLKHNPTEVVKAIPQNPQTRPAEQDPSELLFELGNTVETP